LRTAFCCPLRFPTENTAPHNGIVITDDWLQATFVLQEIDEWAEQVILGFDGLAYIRFRFLSALLTPM
jgi:hypothetical protein